MNGLSGKHVVITRAMHQSRDILLRLEAENAIPLNYPCVEILPPIDSEVLDSKIAGLFAGAFDWLVFTSQNAVLSLSSRMKELRIHQPLPARVKFAAIGTSTALAAHHYLGIDADVVPQIHNSESLAELLVDCRGQKMLLPQADIARPELAQSLHKAGAFVFPVVAYQTQKGTGGIQLLSHLEQRRIDVITFASPSAVHFFKERLTEEGGHLDLLRSICIACIGNVTQKAASDAGLNVTLVAKKHTFESMIQSLKEYYRV